MDKITDKGTFDGTISFVRYDQVHNEKQTPYIEYVCTDSESQNVAYGAMWCSPDAIKYTVAKLRALGVEGETNADVLRGAKDLKDAECSFDTIEDSKGYIKADNVRPLGSATAFEGRGMDVDDFLETVFGATATAPSKKDDEEEAPF